MALIHKFIASFALAAVFAAGPLCTCVVSAESHQVHVEATAASVAHELCHEDGSKDKLASGCLDHCQDGQIYQAVLTSSDFSVPSPQTYDWVLVDQAVETRPSDFHLLPMLAPPPRRAGSDPTLVSLHMQLLV